MVSTIALLTTTAACVAQTYEVVDLGSSPHSIWSTALKISDSGVIVGGSLFSREGGLAFDPLRFIDGRREPYPIDGPSDIANLAINNDGTVVGMYTRADRRSGAFVWKGEHATALPATGYRIAFANDINDQGVIVGGAELADGRNDAVRWLPGREGWEIERIYPGFEGARAINSHGVIAGTFDDRPALWREHSAPTPVVSTGWGFPIDLNDRGETLFYWQDASPGRVCVADAEGITVIDDPDSPFDMNWPLEIAENGDVLGVALLAEGGAPLIWRDGRFIDLRTCLAPDSRWRLVEARGMNNRGQIVGSAIRDGVTHAVLLTSVPEPASLILTLAAAPWLARTRQRNR